MKNLLFIIGTSGSGKSYITSKLSEKEGFYKLLQYTTRAKRENEGNEYYYITKEHFAIIEDRLIATTVVNDNYYGTIPTFKDNGDIAVVIVNALGLRNGLKYLSNHKDINFNVLYLTGESFEERKEGRDVDREREEIEEILSKSGIKYIEMVNSVHKPLSVDELEKDIRELF